MINYKQTIKNFPTTTSTPYTPVSPYYSTHNANKTNAEI